MPKLLPQTTTAALLLGAALLVSSTGGAVAGSLVTGAQIKNGTVSGKDVKDKSLGAAEFAPDAKSALAGPAGPAGPTGLTGLTGVEMVTAPISAVTGPGNSANTTLICPAGKKILSASAYWDNGYAGSISPLSADRVNVTGKNPGSINGQLSAFGLCATF